MRRHRASYVRKDMQTLHFKCVILKAWNSIDILRLLRPRSRARSRLHHVLLRRCAWNGNEKMIFYFTCLSAEERDAASLYSGSSRTNLIWHNLQFFSEPDPSSENTACDTESVYFGIFISKGFVRQLRRWYTLKSYYDRLIKTAPVTTSCYWKELLCSCWNSSVHWTESGASRASTATLVGRGDLLDTATMC